MMKFIFVTIKNNCIFLKVVINICLKGKIIISYDKNKQIC